MYVKTPIKELEVKIKRIEDYLGPKLSFSTDHWPSEETDRWILEYLLELKHILYKRIEYKKNKEEQKIFMLMDEDRKIK